MWFNPFNVRSVKMDKIFCELIKKRKYGKIFYRQGKICFYHYRITAITWQKCRLFINSPYIFCRVPELFTKVLYFWTIFYTCGFFISIK